MLNNKLIGLSDEQLPRVPLPLEVRECEAGTLVPATLALDPSVGLETVLIFVESPTFIRKIRKLDYFNLNLRIMVHVCEFGPVFSLLWWIGDSTVIPKPSEIYETEINPHAPSEMQPFVELSQQEYWHVFMVTPSDEELNWHDEEWYECPSSGELSEAIKHAREIATRVACIDFDMAIKSFHRQYSRRQLIASFFNLDSPAE